MAVWKDLIRSVPLVGDVIAAGDVRRERSKQDKAFREAEGLYGGMQAPDTTISDSAMAGVYADPRDIEAQRRALQYMLDVGAQEGLTAADKAQLAAIRTEQNLNEQAQREAILQQARMRGQLAGGSTLGAQLMAQQSAANRAAQGGLDTAAMAQRRALEAMMAGGQMAGQMRGQGFGEASERASADDIRRQFNANQMSNRFQNQLGLQDRLANLRTGGAQASFAASALERQQDAANRQLISDLAKAAATFGAGGAGGASSAAGAANAAGVKK
jgi:hypothetical protein